MNLDTIVCPGCGWIGITNELGRFKDECSECSYTIGSWPFKMLTIKELLECDFLTFDDVRMDLFLKSVIKVVWQTDLEKRMNLFLDENLSAVDKKQRKG